MALSPDASASAAVAALFFLAALCAPANFVMSGRGFGLYIPLGLSTALWGVAHAARASYLLAPNPNLMAVYGAFNAAGFGISVALCCCFIIIWLRNAVHYQPIKVAAALSAVSKALIAPVIVFGPVLALTAAVIMFGSHNPAAMAQGPRIRLASTAGFTAVAAAATLITAYLAVSWIIGYHKHTKMAAPPAPTAQTSTPDATPVVPGTADHSALTSSSTDATSTTTTTSISANQRVDGLIFVLLWCLLLLCWSAATRLAAFDHPSLAASTQLQYAVSVLPELLMVFTFALPCLAVRMALGGRYGAWHAEQCGRHNRQQQKKKKPAQAQEASNTGVRSNDKDPGSSIAAV